MGPRPAGSEGDRRAVEWGVRTLEGLGFENVRTEEVTVPHWERGENAGRITAPFSQPVVLTALGGSAATPAGGIEAEVLGVGTLEELDALPAGAARGKIVYIGSRMERTADVSGYVRAVQKRALGASRAARLGARALLIRSAGTSTSRIAHTGGVRYEDGVERIPAAALSNVDADLLEAELASGRPVSLRLLLATRDLPEGRSANVIGEIRGREAPEEIVLLGAHLDSWDLGQGAVDDGAGCAIVTAAARLIGELPRRPRRTLRVVLFANEELGLSGARAYTAEHLGEIPHHVAAMEADLGAGAVLSFSSGATERAQPAVERIAALLAPLGIEYAGYNGHGGADVSPLAAQRVPMFGLWQDTTHYFDVHHTVDDTLAQIDPDDLAQNVAAYAVLAYALADLEGDLGPGAEPPESGSR